MLGTISATFAAFAALIATKTHGKTTAYLHVRVHTPVSCPSGQESIGVVGWSSDGCVASGGVCVANVNGACPEGAHCTMLDTGEQRRLSSWNFVPEAGHGCIRLCG
uniref:Uncharacterized protein n=1 Tax=Hyaloperonospora arabidopsidis (strain Emoy2) TaxID=559515 RepID=M4C4Y0_HYAAE